MKCRLGYDVVVDEHDELGVAGGDTGVASGGRAGRSVETEERDVEASSRRPVPADVSSGTSLQSSTTITPNPSTDWLGNPSAHAAEPRVGCG